MRKRIFHVTGLGWLLFCLLLPGLAADQLELKNGDRLSGTILSLNDKVVRLQTSYGTIDVPRNSILRGSFGEVTLVTGATPAPAQEIIVNLKQEPEPVVEIPRKGLVFEFLFNGNFKDTSGKEQIVNKYGPLLFADGLQGRSVLSDGTGTYLELPGGQLIDDLQSFTFSCWVLVQGEAGSQYLISKWENTSGQTAKGKLALSYALGQLYFYIVDQNGTYQGLKVKCDLVLKSWHHVAASYGQGRLEVYLDGQSLGFRQVESAGLLKSSTPLYLLTAKSFTDTTWAFYNLTGRMDNARLYERVLGIEEIRLLASEGGAFF